MWYVNAVCWYRRDITAQEWKVNNGEIEVIPFVVKSSSKLSIVNVEITIQVWGGGCSLPCFLYLKFTWIDELKKTLQILCRLETIHHLNKVLNLPIVNGINTKVNYQKQLVVLGNVKIVKSKEYLWNWPTCLARTCIIAVVLNYYLSGKLCFVTMTFPHYLH